MKVTSLRATGCVIIAVLMAFEGVSVYLWVDPGVLTCGGIKIIPRATQTPIQHVFIIIKENHAFENYFGALPGVAGYPPNGSFPVSLNSSQFVSPFPLVGFSTPDLPHDAVSDLVDLDGGRNDLFVAQAAAVGAQAPFDAVGYYTAFQIPAYYAYAQYYGLGDHYFSGVLGPTAPNRVFYLTGNVGAWDSNTPPPSSVTALPTVLDQMSQHGIGWAYDYSNSSANLAPTWFDSVRSNPCSASRIVPVGELPSQLRSVSVPSVVFVDPSHNVLVSEHPPGNVSIGQDWTVAVVNAILGSSVASTSAIVITFDENGGFWDPIVPPPSPYGLLGFRVPLIVISPWTPPATRCHTNLDPASWIRFIDDNWKLPYLNERAATAGTLNCFFNFTMPQRLPLSLPSNISINGQVAASTTGGSLVPGSSGTTTVVTSVSSPWGRWQVGNMVSRWVETRANMTGDSDSGIPDKAGRSNVGGPAQYQPGRGSVDRSTSATRRIMGLLGWGAA